MRTQIIVIALTLASNAALATPFPHCPDSSRRDYDVIVVGAGTSGIMAAIQATRLGASVALIEEHNMIGGQIAAGVAGIDGGDIPPVRSGLFSEYRNRIHAFYDARGYTANDCFWGSGGTCSSPSVSSQVFWEMLAELPPTGSILCPFMSKKVVGILKSGDIVWGLTTSAPTETWAAHVVIDATEYGDLIDDAGAAYRVGRYRVPGSTEIANNCIQDITYVAVIRDYDSAAAAPDIPQPPGYLLPDPGTPYVRRTQLQAMLNERSDGALEFTTDCPTDWDESRAYVRPGNPPVPFTLASHHGYRAIPDLALPPGQPLPTRTAVNLYNDYPGFWTQHCLVSPPSAHWRGKLDAAFLEDPATRQTITCEAKKLTLQLLHHMQMPEDPTTPALEIQQPWWGIADDEYSTPASGCNFLPDLAVFEGLLPPFPYVRESRRIVAVDTLTGVDIKRVATTDPPQLEMAVNNPAALAVGEYGNDVHNCDDEGDYETWELGEVKADKSTAGGPFQIPFGTFIPELIDGFLPAEKNLGYTRLASSAARVHPSTMLVGQAAGTLAALAALAPGGGIQPRAVRVLNVQKAILESDAALARQTFTDVPIGHPSWRDVQLMATYEIMTFGLPTAPTQFIFGTGSAVQRSHAAGALVRAFKLAGVTPPPWPQRYADVPTTHPEFNGIEIMAQNGFDMTGYNCPSPFCPALGLYRRDMAKWLAYARWGNNIPNQTTIHFTDVPASHPQYQAIEALVNEGLMFGCSPTQFCPDGWTTRNHVAQSLAQVLYKYTSIWP